jgi:hypothetical protein
MAPILGNASTQRVVPVDKTDLDSLVGNLALAVVRTDNDVVVAVHSIAGEVVQTWAVAELA